MNEVMTYSSFWQRAPSKSALHSHVKLKTCVEFGVGLGVVLDDPFVSLDVGAADG